VFLAALWLFFCAHRDLGRNFSSSLKVREGHSLVTTGVYRYVRHPIYASLWLWSVAQALLLPNWLAGSAGFIGFSVLFFGRVAREEQMMLEIFGEDYRAYMARTARIVPGIY
jgi:protein-S-isoprenylcysteine O-methyltransferase Ste14